MTYLYITRFNICMLKSFAISYVACTFSFNFFLFLFNKRKNPGKKMVPVGRKVETPPSLVGTVRVPRSLVARLRARRVSSLERVCNERLRGLANWFSKSQDLDRDLLTAVHDFARVRDGVLIRENSRNKVL